MSEFEDLASYKKDVRDLKSRLRIVPSYLHRTHIIALAVHPLCLENGIARISCSKGIPIGGYVHDAVDDAYVISCQDSLDLGSIPVSFKAVMDRAGMWEIRIPAPENVINRYLNEQQKADLKAFKTKYKQRQEIHYLQLVSSS